MSAERILRCALLAVALLASAPREAAGESFTGKVVAVADGDTITVLRDGAEVRVRLHGVDTPEKAQPFGERAKLFTSNLVFGKQVQVEVVTKDRYGRSVGKVLLPATRTSLNEALVKAGLAWWYRHYAPKDRKLAALEEEARKAKRGLWADASPMPPWQFRHPDLVCQADAECVFLPSICDRCDPCKPTPRPLGNRAALQRIRNTQARVRCAQPTCPPCADPKNWIEGKLACREGSCVLERREQHALPAEAGAATGADAASFHGNLKSKVLHAPGCKDYACKACSARFARLEDATRAGYRSHACVAAFQRCVSRCTDHRRAEARGAAAIEADCRRSCAK